MQGPCTCDLRIGFISVSSIMLMAVLSKIFNAVVVPWLIFTLVWNGMKLPYALQFAKAIGLPWAFKIHPDGISGGQCPLNFSPIARTRVAVKSHPLWVSWHAFLTLLIQAVYLSVYRKSMSVADARLPLTILLILNLPFWMVNIKNLGPVPAHKAKWINIIMTAVISLATLGMWITSPETPFTISFFAWNVVPFVLTLFKMCPLLVILWALVITSLLWTHIFS